MDVFRVVTVVGLGVAVWGNAAAMDAYCARHWQSLSCNNPQEPLPQPPDEMPQVTQASTAPGIVTVISTAPVA